VYTVVVTVEAVSGATHQSWTTYHINDPLPPFLLPSLPPSLPLLLPTLNVSQQVIQDQPKGWVDPELVYAFQSTLGPLGGKGLFARQPIPEVSGGTSDSGTSDSGGGSSDGQLL